MIQDVVIHAREDVPKDRKFIRDVHKHVYNSKRECLTSCKLITASNWTRITSLSYLISAYHDVIPLSQWFRNWKILNMFETFADSSFLCDEIIYSLHDELFVSAVLSLTRGVLIVLTDHVEHLRDGKLHKHIRE